MRIEHYLIRSMTFTGGLAHGKAYKAPFCPNGSRLCLQLMWSSESRKARDKNDSLRLQDWLKLHNPFGKGYPLLVCITNGLITSSTVNYDSAKDIGISPIKSIVGKQFSNISVKK
ncbi:hypothetical protein PR048_008713 [Dryococelus australis]|uniref:Uncharacterized protein n=1 Tax=Dryococelus australis TaxID=614101 RepID=A0ABQ9HXW5_9NEOP|nr:hypothetical protein PR048_008713 [Dryococelus australis]